MKLKASPPLRSAAWLVLCFACKSPPPAAPVRPSGPPYAVLFQLDRAWSLPAEVANGHRQGTAFTVEHAARGFVGCRIGNLRTVGEAKIAHITCEPPLADLLASGTWVSTPAGLFHPAVPLDDQDDVANLDEDDVMIAASPVERQRTRAIAETHVTTEAFEFGAGWCVRDRTTSADAMRGFTLCFDASGVTGGDDVVMLGPLWRRTRFGAMPPADPGDPNIQ